jgi:hypothetical protein
MKTHCALLAAVAAVVNMPAAAAAASIVTPIEDVMTSGFFFSPNFVRGYVGDNRPTFRVSTNGAFGVAGAEAVYIAFDEADFASFTAPVASAVLTVESRDGGFGANAGPGSPFTVSAHGVSADPFTAITDDTNPSGPTNWLDFFNNRILPADTAALTAVESFGAVTFDVTSLVNDWLGGTNTIFVVALTGKNDSSGSNFLHGFANNSDTSMNQGFTFLTVAEVPEPGSLSCLLVASALTWGRRWSGAANLNQGVSR